MVNSSAVFECGSNNSVLWSFRRTGQLADKRIYVGGQLRNPRYSLNRSSDNWYALLISDVQLSDSGLYTCIDNDGFGPLASARLVVLDSLPTCGANVSVNQPVHESQVIELRCVFTYAGDPPPRVRWTGPSTVMHNSSTTLTDRASTAVRLESWIVVTAAAEGVGPYRYTITTYDDDDASDATESTTTPMYIWNSSSFVVLYAVRNVIINMSDDGDVVVVRGATLQCRADGCPPARYQWKNVDTGRTFVGPNLRLDIGGQHNYECIATNLVANVTYSARAQVSLLVTAPPSLPTTTTTTTTTENSAMKLTGSLITAVVIATVTTAIIAVLVVSCVCLVYRLFVSRRRHRRVTLTSSLSSTGSTAAIIRQQVRVWTQSQAATAEFRDKREAASVSCLYDSIDEQDVGYEQLPGGRMSSHHQCAAASPAVRPPGRLRCDAVNGKDAIRGSPRRTLTENDYLYICDESDGEIGQDVCCLQEESNDSVRYIQPQQPAARDDGLYVNDGPATTPAGSAAALSDDGVYIHTLTDD